LIANVQESQFEEVDKTVQSFQEALVQQDVFKLVKLLKKMIPEYKSENSEFTILD